LHCNGFFTENLRCTGPATDKPGCPAALPGVRNDNQFAGRAVRPGKPAEQPGSSVAGLTALNNFNSVIDKYQTGVFSTTCDSPTDAISDCLNVDRMRKRFVAMSFFLVAAVM